MGTRQYEFIVGPTTSELPSLGTPTGTSDLISLGYADENYMQGGSFKSTKSNLKDVASGNRSDGDVRYVDENQWFYKFEASATGSDDNDLTLQPTTGSGRWRKVLQNLGSNFVGLTDTQNVTNKTVSGSVLLEDVYFKSSSGTNRKVGVNASGATNTTQTTLVFVQTANRSVTFQDADQVVMGRDTTDTMTNKTADAMVIKENSYFLSSSGTNRKVAVSASGASNTTQTTLVFAQTSSRAITFQDSDHVVVGRNTTDTLSNKTVQQGTFDDWLDINEESAPSAPSSGKVRVYAKTDKKIYKKTSDGVESEIGAGGGGGVNYCTTPDFEGNAVTGWATYADAAATTPVDGTGGSPNSTFAATSSSPLRGTYSAIFTKGAANRQGEGFSFDFSIATADKSRPIAISWEGSASANYTGSSGSEYMVCYVYDVTNSVLIATSTVNVAQGVSKGYTTFLATTSSSYRLIFHIAGTGTSAWTYLIDSVSISPYLTVQGASASDWQSYTPTIGGGGTPTNMKFAWRRDGADMLIIGSCTLGTVAASTCYISLPTGYTIDTTAPSIGSGARCRLGDLTKGTAGSDTVSNTGIHFVVYYDGTNTDRLGIAQNVASQAFTAANGSYLFSTGDGFFVSGIRVPISGWSANVVMAERAVEEYGSNNGPTWDASNTNDYTVNSNSPAGSLLGGTLTAFRTKVVRFQNPVQSTDHLVIEFSEDRIIWTRVGSFQTAALGIPPMDGYFEATASSSTAGISWSKLTGADVQVNFGRYKWMRGDGTGQTNWDSSVYWRVRKISGGASVGYPVSAANIVVNHNSTPYTDVIKSGTFAVAAVNNSGVTVGAQAKSLQYMQVGNVVTVSGLIENINASSGGVSFDLTVPIARATNFASGDAAGVGIDTGTNTPLTIWAVAALTSTTNKVRLTTLNSGDPSAIDMHVHFTYRLV